MSQSKAKVLVATRLSPTERSAMVHLAASNDRSLSGEIRRAILRHLRAEMGRETQGRAN